MTNFYIIYKHTSPSGKSYIGQTKDLKRRNKEHQTQNWCRAFSNAIKKYGWDNFTHEILYDNLTLEEANVFEELMIKEHKTLYPFGYNLRNGGLNQEMSEETKRLMSEVRKGVPKSELAISKMKGRILSEDHKIQISNSMKGKKKSDEHKKKMSLTRIGIKRTEEQKKAISKKLIGQPSPKKGKPSGRKGMSNSLKGRPWSIARREQHNIRINKQKENCDMSNIGNQVKRTAISAFVELLGHGDLFPRVLAEMKRVNETMPGATGADKRKRLLADAEIIFTDLVEPVAEAVLNLLIELGVQYLVAEAKK